MTTSLRHQPPSSRALILAFVVVLTLVGVGTTGAAGAQEGQDGGDDGTTTTVETPADPSSDIIPDPNSGHEPTEAGDRGGALQLGLLALLVAGIAAAVAKLVHDSRRARAPS